LVDVVVEPDAGGQCEQFGRDSCSEPVEAAGAVAFESETVFEGPEDRFDALADPGQRGSAGVLVAAGWAQDRCAEAFGDVGLEVAAGVALVADDQLAAVQPDLEQPQRDVAFVLVGGGEDRRARGAVRGGCDCGCSDARRRARGPSDAPSRPSGRIRPAWSR
jgi:hypothetical protein